ncbi:type 1 glutamine amidotransferase domain-containing protein [Desulfosediminicola flagellatus]|uniref:type 1 glutamine amidotransferase domain-containing protein n=1 Tax=Desulfosediminicola flagellatus TaxID=2569541 RepID=UPI0010AC29EE|nr:type 1 glutamine amidotransferase domain-containing protein [Desulfosediminicola flagellatus]
MKILMVLTSHDTLGDTGLKTGFWLEEFASPYFLFKDQNFEVTLASPLGGQPPLDPKSDEPDFQTAATARFKQDDQAQKELTNTVRLDSIDPTQFNAIFYPGGHGPLWDLAENKKSISLIEEFYKQGKPVGLVCHAPGVLRHVKDTDGKPLVKGKRVTGFSNTEEEAVQLTEVVPFLVEDMLKENEGVYCKGDDWGSYVEVDKNLVTGQNPASSEAAAKRLIEILNS